MVAVAYELPRSLVLVAREVGEVGEVGQVEEVAQVEELGEVARWQRVHVKLRRIARKRAALDREELQLIREAIRIALWRHVGATSIRDYLEQVCGYGPNVASERVRVAEALDAMPALERALGEGELSYSAVRAISRIATNRTERAWIAASRGKTQRQIEELLAEREVGDLPEAPRRPELRARNRTYRGITPATEAALELARRELEAELGERLDDNQLLFLLASRATAGGAPRKKAAAQVAVTVCPSCQVGRQLAGNRAVALRSEELARVFCDVQWIDITGQRRAIQDVTPALRAKVMLRDHGRCRVPGCRAAANIEVHHIVPRSRGGAHAMENLIALCDGHHVALHAGQIRIEGPADVAVIVNLAAGSADAQGREDAAVHGRVSADGPVHVEDRSDQSEPRGHTERAGGGREGGGSFHVETARRDAVLALTTLGFAKHEARSAVDAAVARGGELESLEQLVRAALRRA